MSHQEQHMKIQWYFKSYWCIKTIHVREPLLRSCDRLRRGHAGWEAHISQCGYSVQFGRNCEKYKPKNLKVTYLYGLYYYIIKCVIYTWQRSVWTILSTAFVLLLVPSHFQKIQRSKFQSFLYNANIRATMATQAEGI